MTVHYREIRITPSNRAAAVALGAGVVVAGGVLLVVGATLLLAAGVVGIAAGSGVMLWRRLTRGAVRGPGGPLAPRERGLDPSLEVFPPDDARRLPPAP